MFLGLNAGSSGTYRLSGGGLLTVLNGETIGGSGSGCFTQAGGTNHRRRSRSWPRHRFHGNLRSQRRFAESFRFGPGRRRCRLQFLAAEPSRPERTFPPACPSFSARRAAMAFSTPDGNTLTLDGNLSGPGGLEEIGGGLLVLGGDECLQRRHDRHQRHAGTGQRCGPPRRFEPDRRGGCPVDLRRRPAPGDAASRAGTVHAGPWSLPRYGVREFITAFVINRRVSDRNPVVFARSWG